MAFTILCPISPTPLTFCTKVYSAAAAAVLHLALMIGRDVA